MADFRQGPKRAVVFGASGGIGRALVAALLARGCEVWAGSRSGESENGAVGFRFDLTDEASIAAVAGRLRDTPPDLVLVATGALTLPGGTAPERSLRQIDANAMAQAFALNAIGPALIAKHVLPLLPREGRSVFAALSARVGSLGDNRLGGWHAYRASKAALNMLLRNFALELARTHREAIVVGLHPGTVDSALSAPFQRNLAAEQLTSPAVSAAHLLAVVDVLTPEHSGRVIDWRGDVVPD